MLQHDITNSKYYENGVEITAEEYAVKFKEWQDNLPPAPEPLPPGEEEATPEEAIDILLGGESEW